jgi:hypothetical protein
MKEDVLGIFLVIIIFVAVEANPFHEQAVAGYV